MDTLNYLNQYDQNHDENGRLQSRQGMGGLSHHTLDIFRKD